jgi:hypothetical protein
MELPQHQGQEPRLEESGERQQNERINSDPWRQIAITVVQMTEYQHRRTFQNRASVHIQLRSKELLNKARTNAQSHTVAQFGKKVPWTTNVTKDPVPTPPWTVNETRTWSVSDSVQARLTRTPVPPHPNTTTTTTTTTAKGQSRCKKYADQATQGRSNMHWQLHETAQ